MLETPIVVRVHEGLHARPATQFAKLAKQFSSSLKVCRGETSADAKSAVKLMLLCVKQNEEVVLCAEGSDEDEATRRLLGFLSETSTAPEADASALNDEHTGDTDAAAAPTLSEPALTAAPSVSGMSTIAAPVAAATRTDAGTGNTTPLRGVGASEGLACATAFVYLPEQIKAAREFIGSHEIGDELARFRVALVDSIAFLGNQSEAVEGDDEIIEALTDVAQSDDFSGAVEARIETGRDAVASTLQIGEDLASAFAHMPDEYLRSRADDIRAISRQVATRLLGQDDMSLAGLKEPCIVLASDLSAVDFARARTSHIAGLVCLKGSATSHLAIMARSHGIPAVLGLSVTEAQMRHTTRVAIDGSRGEVWLDPVEGFEQTFASRIAQEKSQQAALRIYQDIEPVTRDGRAIEVMANLGSLSEIEAALEAGAMGVGLFRTELLFMDRGVIPDEEEQADIYSRLAKAFHPKPVVIRTLDVGGDKPIPGIAFPEEDNPFLGWRGIRMCLDRPDVFMPQLRALLRAAVVGNVQVMLPMVDDVEEVRRVKVLLGECAQSLAAQGIACGMPKLGIMVETPAAALTADDLAKEVDFFSIGTNDLTQYVMAVDRMNPALSSLYRTDHPAVLRAIGMVCEAAKKANISVAVCGEAAARPEMIPLLLGLGVNELSMSPSSILRAKRIITELP
jgi:phosphotransferase system enzyme I (PtsI)